MHTIILIVLLLIWLVYMVLWPLQGIQRSYEKRQLDSLILYSAWIFVGVATPTHFLFKILSDV